MPPNSPCFLNTAYFASIYHRELLIRAARSNHTDDDVDDNEYRKGHKPSERSEENIDESDEIFEKTNCIVPLTTPFYSVLGHLGFKLIIEQSADFIFL